MLESIHSRWCIISVSFQLNGSVQPCQATLQHTSLGAICTCELIRQCKCGHGKHASKCACAILTVVLYQPLRLTSSNWSWIYQACESCISSSSLHSWLMTSRIWRSKRKAINGWTPFSQELRRDNVGTGKSQKSSNISRAANGISMGKQFWSIWQLRSLEQTICIYMPSRGSC